MNSKTQMFVLAVFVSTVDLRTSVPHDSQSASNQMSFAIVLAILTIVMLSTESISHLPSELWIESLTFLPTTDPAIRNGIRLINKLSKQHSDAIDVYQLSNFAKVILPDEYQGIPQSPGIKTAQDYLRFILDKPWIHRNWNQNCLFLRFWKSRFKFEWDHLGAEFIVKLLHYINGGEWSGWILGRFVAEISSAIQYHFGRALLNDDLEIYNKIRDVTRYRSTHGFIRYTLLNILIHGIPRRNGTKILDFSEPGGWVNALKCRKRLISNIHYYINKALKADDEELVFQFLIGLKKSKGLDQAMQRGEGEGFLWCGCLDKYCERKGITAEERERMKTLLSRNLARIRGQVTIES